MRHRTRRGLCGPDSDVVSGVVKVCPPETERSVASRERKGRVERTPDTKTLRDGARSHWHREEGTGRRGPGP